MDDIDKERYPYIFKPPESPDDIRPAFQTHRIKEKEEPQTEFDCPYCRYKLSKEQKYCPIYGKDVF